VGALERTGLPATVTKPRIWPSPRMSISSAMAATGSCPPNSGRPRTRDFQRFQRLMSKTRPMRPRSMAGVVNMAPPSRSRLPVSRLTTSMSQEASQPNSFTLVPTRP
jgi:hypothetical protein